MPVPEPHDLRASDAERERVAQALRDGAAAGRLDADELEERLGRAYGAQVRGDLAPLVADLPEPSPAPRPARRQIPQVPPFVAIAVLLIVIWAVSGGGYFWPLWPIGAMALGACKGHGRCGVARRPGLAKR